MDEQVLKSGGVYGEVLGFGGLAHADGDGVEHRLVILEAPLPHKVFEDQGVEPAGDAGGARCAARVDGGIGQAQATGHLPARHADSVMRALLEHEVIGAQTLLDLFEVARQCALGNEEGLRQLLELDPVIAHEQIVEEVVHALLGGLARKACMAATLCGDPGVQTLLIKHAQAIPLAADQLDNSTARQGLIGPGNIFAQRPRAHAELRARVFRRHAVVLAHKCDELHVLHGQTPPSCDNEIIR